MIHRLNNKRVRRPRQIIVVWVWFIAVAAWTAPVGLTKWLYDGEGFYKNRSYDIPGWSLLAALPLWAILALLI
jgi:hypothetical protein